MSFASAKQMKVTREDLASDTGQGILSLANNNAKLMELHKNLLQSNMTLTAYVDESRKMIADLKISIAMTKTHPTEVIEILH